MRIAIFSDIYTPSRDGVRTSIEQARIALEKQGHTVLVVTPSVPGFSAKEPGVIRLASIPNLATPTTAPTFRVAIPYPGLVRRLARDLGNIDVVHSHTQGGLGQLAFEVARRKGVPLVHTVHGFMYEVARKTPLQMSLLLAVMFITFPPYLWVHGRSVPHYRLPAMPWRERWMLRFLLSIITLADELIVPSPHVEKRLRGYGVAEPIHVVPSTIDPTPFRAPGPPPTSLELPEPQGVRIVSVGRVSAEKRIEELVQALGKLPALPKWDAVIVGEGPSLDRCRHLARRARIGDQVHFMGSQPSAVVAQVLHQSDIFVLSSWHFDTQALVLLEATHSGLPIVYCDERLTIGLTPENAVLAKKNPAGLAAALSALIANPKRRARLAAGARKISREFVPAGTAKQLIAVYSGAIKAMAKPTPNTYN
jgi:1,2-diacylglycerol 3-alpha-glucosyltransferase